MLVVEGQRNQNLEQESLCESTILRILVAQGGSMCDKDAVCVDKYRLISKNAALMLSPVRHRLRFSIRYMLCNAT